MSQKANFLKSLVFIAGMLFIGCQADDTKESDNTQASEIPILRKEFKKFEKLPDLLSEVLPKEQSFSARGNNATPLTNFVIDSTSVTEITNNGIVYYTLAVSREATEEGTFENLVVFDNDGEKKAVLVKYKPDASFLSRRETNPDAQFSGKINMTELNPAVTFSRRSTTVTKCFVSTHKFCTNGAPGTLAGPGCYTSSDGGAHVKSVTTINCFEVVVNKPQPYLDFSYVSPAAVSDGGGGNPEAGLPIATQPIFLSTIEFRFVRRLNAAQKQWWNSGNNNAAVASIFNFLKENTYDGTINNEAREYAKNLINLAIEKNSSFVIDMTLTPHNALTFNTFEDFKEYINSENREEATIEYEQDLSQKIATAKFKINPLINLNIKVKQTISPYKISNVTSTITGITFGNEWKQSEYTVNITGNIVTIDVYGTSSVSVFVEGIGTIYSKERHYQIKINKTSGEVIATLVL